jgi:hypothetical protein
MKRNFFETIVLEPKEKDTLTNEKFLKDIQEIVDILLAPGTGTIDAKFRKSIDKDHPERIFFAAAWETIEDHDEFDIKGLVPKLLKMMLTHLTPVSGQFMFMDSAKVDFDAPVWMVNAYHVKEEEKALFQREIDTSTGLVGAWYTAKKIPPLPSVMPTDLVELQILEEGMKRAEARLKAPTPNIWMSISTPDAGSAEVGFGEKVKSYVQEVQSGQYEKFVGGKQN